jgi:peptidoglycan hydrolase-like protein with peptidoglycan-binding domain
MTAAPHEILVADAQRIAISLGETLKPDGLFGPKTAAAWGRLAQKQGLPADFIRLGPRTAQVDAVAYDKLRSAAQNPRAVAKAQASKLAKGFASRIFGDVYIP